MLKDKILEAVKRLELDLSGKVVLTEAASGPYVVTAALAAVAGAQVFAYTKSTRYGSIDDVKRQTYDLAKELNVDASINVIDTLSGDIISKADIITNSGHLRSLNKEKLQHAKEGVVIPLMYEAWEWREGDLDLSFCREKNIVVAATNERHEEVDVFNYLGDMALKIIFDAGTCPYRNKFILICNNDFGPFIAKVLSKVCDGLAVCDTEDRRKAYDGIKIDWIGNFPDIIVPDTYKNATVIFTAYPFEKKWIGNNDSTIPVSKLKSQLSNPMIIRYAGDIDEDACKDQIDFYPLHVHSGHMGILPSAIGYDPIIRLQSGGLKVGEMLLKNETHFKGVELVNFV